MRGPLLVVDADQRFQEMLDLADDRVVYALSSVAADNTDPDRIVSILAENMPGSDVRTIVVDSLTAIITPLVVRAMVDKDAGREKNLAAAFRAKALAMRQLQDAVTRWGTDVLWIYHIMEARNEKGNLLTRATVPQTELARLTRSINMHIEIVTERDKRGIKVVWARRGRSGMILWDETGKWAGMPERIEEAVYSAGEQDRIGIENAPPEVFPSAEAAIAWGFAQGAFKSLEHARNAYEKLKREKQPQNAREMARLWVADVQARLAAAIDDDDERQGGAG